MKNIYLSFVGLCRKFSWLPRLLAQVSIGIVFAESGWGKLHNLEKVIAFFDSLHIPAAHIQAPMVATIEFVCGILVFLGLGTRIAALPLIGTMVVAIVTAKAPDFESWTDLFGISEFLMIIILVYLVTEGASCISCDHLISRKAQT